MTSASSGDATTSAGDSSAASGGLDITVNGPYEVTGEGMVLRSATIEVDEHGTSTRYSIGQEQPLPAGTRLCRCGDSSKKPFCDGSHERTTADLTETAARDPYSKHPDVIPGPELTLHDDESLCAYARFCDAGERVWTEVTLPGEKHEDLVKHVASSCPGGRLLLFSSETGDAVPATQATGVYTVEDPRLGVHGPLMVAGGIAVTSSSGEQYQVRLSQALCRCGRSGNKPFCDGSHAATDA